MKKLLLLIIFLMPGYTFPAGQFTEKALFEIETKNGAKGVYETPPKAYIFRAYPVLLYTEAFDAGVMSAVTPETKQSATKGVEGAVTVATSPFFTAGGLNSATGAIGNTATVIAAAGIGLNIVMLLRALCARLQA